MTFVRATAALCGVLQGIGLVLAVSLAPGGFMLGSRMTFAAEPRQPLLVEGKRTLPKRVLTRPGGTLQSAPGQAGGAIEMLPPFVPLYVFAEIEDNAAGWIEVGRTRTAADGWLPAERAIPWAQTIVAAFSNPAGRQRSLVFETRNAMHEAFNSEDVIARLNQLRSEAQGGVAPSGGPIVSIEPDTFVDIDSNFYILPILEFERVRVQSGQRAKYLKIASLPRDVGGSAADGRSREELLADYRVGIVFVIDTTVSMQNYIDETQDAVDEIRRRIADSPEGERVRFGLVGFRDDTSQRPQLEYVTKVFLKLDAESTASEFVETIGTMTAARISSEGFTEDSIAGVMAALDDMEWEPFGGRFIVLVTDAGPREPGEGAVHGSLAVAELNRLAREKSIVIYSLHLKTEQGSFDHESAEQAYRELSATAQGRTLYFDIDAGDEQSFRDVVVRLATPLSDQIRETIQGRLSEVDPHAGGSVEAETRLVGRAMQLAYLGRAAGTPAPDIFEGWISDRDPTDRGARPVEARVLMTKNELATLRDVVRETIDIGNSTVEQGNSQEFFRRLQEAVAHMARDPQRIVDTNFTTLGGALGEYLADLPYDSEITGLTGEDWQQLSPSGERALIDSLESKIVALDRIHNDSARWVAPFDGAPDGEFLTTVPLTVLP